MESHMQVLGIECTSAGFRYVVIHGPTRGAATLIKQAPVSAPWS